MISQNGVNAPLIVTADGLEWWHSREHKMAAIAANGSLLRSVNILIWNHSTVLLKAYHYQNQITPPPSFVVQKVIYDLAMRSFKILKVRTLVWCHEVPLDVSIC